MPKTGLRHPILNLVGAIDQPKISGIEVIRRNRIEGLGDALVKDRQISSTAHFCHPNLVARNAGVLPNTTMDV